MSPSCVLIGVLEQLTTLVLCAGTDVMRNQQPTVADILGAEYKCDETKCLKVTNNSCESLNFKLVTCAPVAFAVNWATNRPAKY